MFVERMKDKIWRLFRRRKVAVSEADQLAGEWYAEVRGNFSQDRGIREEAVENMGVGGYGPGGPIELPSLANICLSQTTTEPRECVFDKAVADIRLEPLSGDELLEAERAYQAYRSQVASNKGMK